MRGIAFGRALRLNFSRRPKMSDDSVPYDKAVAETAKATGKFLDIVRDVGKPVASAYGLLIGDPIDAWRSVTSRPWPAGQNRYSENVTWRKLPLLRNKSQFAFWRQLKAIRGPRCKSFGQRY